LKTISWNCISISLPKDWEVTAEGGSRYNGFITIAPPEGYKLEIYWRTGDGGSKLHDKYVKKFVKKGFKKISRSTAKIKNHECILEVLEKNGYKVIVTTWFCSESKRFFITQLDGLKASLSKSLNILNTLNCHLCSETTVPWGMMGLGLKLYSDYYVYIREFKISYSMAYFLSNDKKIHVIQYAIPKYVIDSHENILDEAKTRAYKMLIPRFTKLDLVEKNNYFLYSVSNVWFKFIKYGYIVEKINECFKPNYIQLTLIRVLKKERINEAIDIAENIYCTEW